jgi:hypothetical protein
MEMNDSETTACLEGIRKFLHIPIAVFSSSLITVRKKKKEGITERN